MHHRNTLGNHSPEVQSIVLKFHLDLPSIDISVLYVQLFSENETIASPSFIMHEASNVLLSLCIFYYNKKTG